MVLAIAMKHEEGMQVHVQIQPLQVPGQIGSYLQGPVRIRSLDMVHEREEKCREFSNTVCL